MFCQRSIEIVSAYGGLPHEVVPVVRQLIHFMFYVGSCKVLVSDQATAGIQHTLNYRLVAL